MKSRVSVAGMVVAVVAMLAVAGLAGAQEGEKPKLTPEQQAEMDAWMKAGTPGAMHKALDPTIGSWTVKATSWQTPGGPPQTGSGTAEDSWVLGGRFVREDFDGEFGGMKFQGLGYTGYDNLKKKYVGTWMDTMGTMVMVMTGTADPSGKVITLTSTMPDVMTGKSMKMRNVTRIVDANTHVMEMYGPDRSSGKEFKMMEIVYTRK
jgi:hypothetical protein